MNPLCPNCLTRKTFCTEQPKEGDRYQCEKCHNSEIIKDDISYYYPEVPPSSLTQT